MTSGRTTGGWTRLLPRTLRGRLTVGLVAVLLVAGAVGSVATALFLHSYLVQRLDSQLADVGGRYSAGVDRHHELPPGIDDDGDGDVDGGQPVGTIGISMADGRISSAIVITRAGHSRQITLDPADRALLRDIPVDGQAHDADLDAVGDYRVRAVTGRDGDVEITGLPLHEVHAILGRLAIVEVSLFALVTLVFGAITAAFVRRTLRPLEDVTAAARHVAELPLTDAGTEIPTGIAPAEARNEVDSVSLAFDAMLDHLRHALGERDHTEEQLRRFVADASHELRTPLATIRAYTEYAVRTGEPIPEPTETALARIGAASARMAALVEDLLLLARLDAGRPLAREPVDLTQVVVEAVDDHRTARPDHRWRLELPEDPVELVGDAPRLHQVLSNLLGNAAAHTPAGTTVVTSLRSATDSVVVEVCDNGPGIPPELRADLFDRFTRADVSRSSGHADGRDSTGLGLAIARGIVGAHGGSIAVDTGPGRTCFTVTLPAPSHRAPDSPGPAEADPDPRRDSPTPSPARSGHSSL